MGRFCDRCKKSTSTKELGRKVRDKYLCKKCKKETREERRKETIEDAGIKDDLRELKNKNARECRARKKQDKDYGNQGAPIPKGSKVLTKERQTDCHLTFQERQVQLRMLMTQGMTFEDAKERIQNLVDSQRELGIKLRKKDTSKEEIRAEQQKLLEKLWQE